MRLIKHYDFTIMQSLDLSEWNIEIGEKWANNERQHYVDHPENLYFDNGLVIKATVDENQVVKSARINTKSKFYFKYGKIDIIAKIPKGKGTWCALWMMPQESVYGRWPKSGEIDIMEHVGNELDKIYTCIHTESYNHTKLEQYYHDYKEPNISDDFHTFSLEWDENHIRYFLDGSLMHTYQKGEDNKDTSEKGWPFDQSFYLIINLAIGGTLGGKVDIKDFPQSFIIKDIKVYQKQ